jgi:cell wall-associated NlpC family hydrolase
VTSPDIEHKKHGPFCENRRIGRVAPPMQQNALWTFCLLCGTFESVRLFRRRAREWVRLFRRPAGLLRRHARRLMLVYACLLTVTGMAAGLLLAAGSPGSRPGHASSRTVAARHTTRNAGHNPVAPLGQLRQASLLIVAPHTLPARLVTLIARQPGVTGTEPIDAARMEINGVDTAVMGVDPSTFRGYAPAATAKSDAFWQGVADAGVAVSRSAKGLGKLPLGTVLAVAGQRPERLPLTGLGSLGVAGVGAVVSETVASSLGMPAANALIVSVPASHLTAVLSRVNAMLPRGAAAAPLVSWVTSAPGDGAHADGSAITQDQVGAMLRAALSRRGLPYLWGAAGPKAFDCSGLVQWSFAQAGIAVPRVADDQALTGQAVPVSQLTAGDLLFYRTERSRPGYISHVAIYLGNGWMIQAPQAGLNVEVVPVALGAQFAGAIQVSPELAGSLAAVMS